MTLRRLRDGLKFKVRGFACSCDIGRKVLSNHVDTTQGGFEWCKAMRAALTPVRMAHNSVMALKMATVVMANQVLWHLRLLMATVVMANLVLWHLFLMATVVMANLVLRVKELLMTNLQVIPNLVLRVQQELLMTKLQVMANLVLRVQQELLMTLMMMMMMMMARMISPPIPMRRILLL